MSGLRCRVFSQVCAFFGEEVGAFLAGSFPAFTEPGVTAAPVIEGVIRWAIPGVGGATPKVK